MSTKKSKTQIWSIFGQLEAVIAQLMVGEGKCNKIDAEAIPATARYNDAGQRALFALVIPTQHVAEFERRLADLRA